MDWFKVYSKGWLTGSIREQLTAEERSVWIDLLAMASESRVRGVVCRARGVPYTREYLANYLGVPLDVLNTTIEKCQQDCNSTGDGKRLEIDKDGCIVIGNWERYQRVPGDKKAYLEDAKEREYRERRQTRKLATQYPDEVMDKVLPAIKGKMISTEVVCPHCGVIYNEDAVRVMPESEIAGINR